MSETVTMPKLGFDMQEGTLVRWVKLEGDEVNKGDVLAEIETDKATVEVESGFSGAVARHLVNQGDVVPVGTAIAIIAAPGEKIEDASKIQEPSPEKTPTAERASKQPTAEKPVSQPLTEKSSAPSETERGGDGRTRATPLARKVASEKGIDLRQVRGTGPGGRIQRSDVEEALRAVASQAATAAPAVGAAVPAPSPAKSPAQLPPAPIWSGAAAVSDDEVIKVSRLRGAIGRRMVESKTQVPHFYITRTYKFEKVMELRRQLNEYLPDDQKLTVNDFIIKAVALTLRQFPNINASLRGDEIVRHGHVNISSAVSIEGGLMTVVVKDADQKPLRLISAEMRELSGRARQGKVRPEDVEGSTFSISNMGMYDVDHFIAIINPPEAGILAVGSAMQVPVVEDGQVTVGTRMKATISIDHRVSDGAEGARFMQALAAFLEEPMRMVL
jgi:pyruvate dehydrogenase E2 component (dihydrolipoamide acetyltransferase)